MNALALLCVSAVAGQTSEKVYGGTAGKFNDVVGRAVTHSWDGYVGSAAGLSHTNGYIDAWDEEYCITNALNTNFDPVNYIMGLRGLSGNYSAIGILGAVLGHASSEDLSVVNSPTPSALAVSFYPSTISYATHEFNFGEFAVPEGISTGESVFLTITVSDMDDFCRHSPPLLENSTIEVSGRLVTTLACVLETVRLFVDGVLIPPATGTRSTLAAAPGSVNSTITYVVNFTLLPAHDSTVTITASQGLTLSAYWAAVFRLSSADSNVECYGKTHNTSCCTNGPSGTACVLYQSPCDTASGMRVEHLFLSADTGTTAATSPATATTPPTLAADSPTSKSKDNSMDKVALGIIIGLSAIIVIGVVVVAFGPIKRCFHRSQTSQNNDSLLLG